MISGKEAKLAWANGQDVQIKNTIVGEDFYSLTGDNAKLGVFDLDFYQFRLKPQTITINGIEVPKPFKPKDGDAYWYLTDDESSGYSSYSNYSDVLNFGAWRTEEEIKQVVEALRQIFK